MEKVYALSEADYATLREMAAAWRSGELGRPMGKPRTSSSRSEVIFGFVDATVTGTTGAATKPISGTLSVYGFTSTGGTTDAGFDETIYNATPVSMTTGQWVVGVRDFKSGNFFGLSQGGEGQLKPLCRFRLDAALATADASKAAVITAQYGCGVAHSTTSTITVYNLQNGAASAYLFEGSSGDAGLAYWDSARNWRIVQMECP